MNIMLKTILLIFSLIFHDNICAQLLRLFNDVSRVVEKNNKHEREEETEQSNNRDIFMNLQKNID